MKRAAITLLLAALAAWMTASTADPIAMCDTDTDCAERFGGNGDPE